MPYLPEVDEQIVKIILPSTEDQPEADQAWVEMDAAPLRTLDMIEIDGIDGANARGVQILLMRIKKWNLTDKEGVLRPINEHYISLLPLSDSNYLSERLTKPKLPLMGTEEKKN